MLQASLTLLSREGGRRQTIEAGLLTDGSPYSPTPSRWMTHQWLPRLAFVPDHSGAPVRESHPLPAASPLQLSPKHVPENYRTWGDGCQSNFAGKTLLSMAWGDRPRCGPTGCRWMGFWRDSCGEATRLCL
jgi:hypothetical protein